MGLRELGDRSEYFSGERIDLDNGYVERPITWFKDNIFPEFEKLRDPSWRHKSFLDVGCASGYFTVLFQPYFAFVGGVDYTKGRIDYAKANREKPDIQFRQANIFADDISSLFGRQFDVLFSTAVIPHIPIENKPDVFSNLAKCTKPGGMFVMYDGLDRDMVKDQFVGLLTVQFLDNLKDWALINVRDLGKGTNEIILQKK